MRESAACESRLCVRVGGFTQLTVKQDLFANFIRAFSCVRKNLRRYISCFLQLLYKASIKQRNLC